MKDNLKILAFVLFLGLGMALAEWLAQFEILGWAALLGLFAGLVNIIWKLGNK